jgi:hypothetical protein
VDAGDPVREHSVRYVPRAEPDQRVAEEGQVGPRRGEIGAAAPQLEQRDGGDGIHQRMENTVGEDLRAHVLHGVDVREQVMPLQDLVQQDAVEKTAERETQQQTGPLQGAGGDVRAS